MSWSEVYPIFTEEMLDEYDSSTPASAKDRVAGFFETEQTFNPQAGSHIVSISLLWKDRDAAAKRLLAKANDGKTKLGKAIQKTGFWQQNVIPLLEQVPMLLAREKDLSVRVYLEWDLEFLIPMLVAAGCEVRRMKQVEEGFRAGDLWRFLPFGEEGKLITVSTPERIPTVGTDIERTQLLSKSELGVWRIPRGAVGGGIFAELSYRPLSGLQMGVVGGWPMVQLLEAFAWSCLSDKMSYQISMPGYPPLSVSSDGHSGLDLGEWFLATVFFPRSAMAGMLTFAPTASSSMLMLLDIEYSTWANPNSQLVFYRVESKGCC